MFMRRKQKSRPSAAKTPGLESINSFIAVKLKNSLGPCSGIFSFCLQSYWQTANQNMCNLSSDFRNLFDILGSKLKRNKRKGVALSGLNKPAQRPFYWSGQDNIYVLSWDFRHVQCLESLLDNMLDEMFNIKTSVYTPSSLCPDLQQNNNTLCLQCKNINGSNQHMLLPVNPSRGQHYFTQIAECTCSVHSLAPLLFFVRQV